MKGTKMENNNKIDKVTEEILDEIECNIFPQGDDTWGVTAECDRDYLEAYIKAKIYELLGD